MSGFISGGQWSARYKARSTPWDLGRAHPELLRRLKGELGQARSRRAFVPGCGRGHDAVAIAKAGWSVVALDYADHLLGELEQRMTRLGGRAIIADAFDYDGGPFDLVFDHTFFCAIEPSRRREFGDLLRRVTEPGAKLVSVVFPIGRSHDEPSPPWGVETGDLTDALGGDWTLILDEPALNPPGRQWKARWGEWKRVR